MADVKLQAIISAKDETSGAINKAQNSFVKLTAAIGLGTAAADIFKKGIGLVKNFLQDSVNSALDAEKAQTRLAHIVSTSTGATKEQIQALINQAESLEKIGVVGAEVTMVIQGQLASFDLQSESIGRLVPSMLNYIVAEKGINASAEEGKALVNSLAQALNGNFASLTKTGFVLDETTKKMISSGTETERVAALTKVLDSTYGGLNEKMRTTAAGGIKGLQLAFDNVRKTIGSALIQGFTPFLESLTNSTIRSGDTTKATIELGKTMFKVAQIAIILARSILTVYNIIQTTVGSIGQLLKGTSQFMADMSAKIKNFFGANEVALNLMGDSTKNYQKDLVNLSNSFDDLGMAFKDLFTTGYDPSKIKLSELKSGTKDLNQAFGDSTDTLEENKKKLEEHKKAVQDGKDKIGEFRLSVIQAFREVRDSIKNDLITEIDNFNKAVAELAADTEKNISTVQKTFEAAAAGLWSTTGMSIAEILVAKQDEAAKLQEEINASTNENEKISLQERLDAINDFLTKHQSDIEENQNEIKTIRDNDLTDEINRIRYQADQKFFALQESHDNEIAEIKRTAGEKLTQMDEEHRAKMTKINSQMDDVKKTYKTKFNELHRELRKSKLFELLDDLQNIGEKLMKKKKKTSFETGLSEFITSLGFGGRQMGGPVIAGQPYMVGEQGQELFVPAQSGTIIPNNQMGGAININFNNPTVRSENDMSRLISEVRRALNREQVLEQLRI